MAKTRQQKEELIKKLDTIVKNANSMVFVHFAGLTVLETSELRNKLRSEGVGYTVPKKRLLKRVLDTRKFEGQLPELSGEIAIAYGDDQLTPAREVFEFGKKHKEQISIVGGIYEEAYRDQAFMLSIATIPSREVLYAQFVNLINSPIQRLAVALNEVAKTKEATSA